jgi:hypothetical protein
MKHHTILLALVLSCAFLVSTAAWAGSPVENQGLGVPANRIVGLWSTEGATQPCGSTLPFTPVRNTILFQAGGTVIATPRFPPAGALNVFGVPGVNQRGPDLGTWSFDPLTQEYTVKLRFDWYVDGQYHGYQTVDRTIALNEEGDAGIGPVRSTRYAADGTVIIEVCGEAMSERL